jgi:hypothetical protein
MDKIEVCATGLEVVSARVRIINLCKVIAKAVIEVRRRRRDYLVLISVVVDGSEVIALIISDIVVGFQVPALILQLNEVRGSCVNIIGVWSVEGHCDRGLARSPLFIRRCGLIRVRIEICIEDIVVDVV